MNVTFYFDPSCPFSWITSRWLILVMNERNVNVRWQPFSLALNNDELSGNNKSPHSAEHRQSHRILRVMLEIEKAGIPLIDSYTIFGTQRHIFNKKYDDNIIDVVLSDLGLPAELSEAADDTSCDQKLIDSINIAKAAAGNDTGVPVIVFGTTNNQQRGYFGPVLNELPNKEESLKLWDGLSKLATTDSFYELKRARPNAAPDTKSTAKLN